MNAGEGANFAAKGGVNCDIVGTLLPLILTSVWHLDAGAILGTEPPVDTFVNYFIGGIGNVGTTPITYSYSSRDHEMVGYVRGSNDDSNDNPPWRAPFVSLNERTFYFAWTSGSGTIDAGYTDSVYCQLTQTDSAEAWYNDGTDHRRRTRKEWKIGPKGIWTDTQPNGSGSNPG